MSLTDFHAAYYAHELTKRCSSDSVEKLASVLADAQVDLNPHQVEAALFAFRSPFSKGAILADEVGLGKTIEAGLLLAQKWAERKRRLLVIAPANLRKQWSQEMADKFFLPSVILENKSFNEIIKGGNLNPFNQDGIVLCSYQFARTKEPYLRQTPWDLVVIDEAHRLRNVYKSSSKIANAIKNAIAPFPKVLLTATPLQNSLLELYGLVSIIDDFAFGDFKSYKAKFARLGNDTDFDDLKERLKPLCKRTLRRQVLEYIKYTNRHALVQEFVPSDDEQRLYDIVSDYLQQPTLYALPASQRQLMTLILRKLLASSTYAISGTLDGLVKKLEAAELAATSVDSVPDDLPQDIEELDELADEWEGDDDGAAPAEKARLSPEQVGELKEEMEQLREFHRLANSIVSNSKGDVLLTALRRGFEAATEAQKQQGAATLQQKAIIFTESRRTQEYLVRILDQTEFAGKVMLFNGTNNDPVSKDIYKKWLKQHEGTDRISGSATADMRAALVENFRDNASILIATEAAAEGINLQFCNLVVNYDLPWNPQRIEQRIGRCHRYGQRFDVVVVNFINKSNAADIRVYELLAEKFCLFNGVFGASDEVLGAVESGVDFEKRIAAIYQQCRTPEQIQFEFDQLQRELETEIIAGQRDAREKLLDNFDSEVVEKVKIQSHDLLDRFNEQLWRLTCYLLANHASFQEQNFSFTLSSNPFPTEIIHPGPYRMGKAVEDANTYRVGHPLAQHVLQRGMALAPAPAHVIFDLSSSGKNIAILNSLRGKTGWLTCALLTMSALEIEDQLILCGITDDGDPLDDAQCRRFFDLPAKQVKTCATPIRAITVKLELEQAQRRQELLDEMTARNGSWFDAEMDKLDKWAEDRRTSLKVELSDLDDALKEARKGARTAPTLPDKLERQRAVRTLESKRDEAWRAYDLASREIERQKDDLLDEIGKRLEQQIEQKELFLLRWSLL
ncbi:MAG: DEAD/DEAH box helicase [Geobacteraceae bacterium GWC2_55_20]|nr:MAG: DEAD/DEAH box helicase [Geobacteraceae bacterium GWC2_55_20]OGU25005.1 MAG: DEAD/DEAH box helicase [Geobacteraceae bacterium GWF2_54_21]HCE67389.1 DEAD/DEAH box helicase [Geobacter sp.]